MKQNKELEKIVHYITTHPHMAIAEGCEMIVNWANSQVVEEPKVVVATIDPLPPQPDVLVMNQFPVTCDTITTVEPIVPTVEKNEPVVVEEVVAPVEKTVDDVVVGPKVEEPQPETFSSAAVEVPANQVDTKQVKAKVQPKNKNYK